uniref:SFRICE_003112 n=1 Tax=Spodoptera frugiperda TaxID=7108 RepID=A0A2H1WZK7_SPOFR
MDRPVGSDLHPVAPCDPNQVVQTSNASFAVFKSFYCSPKEVPIVCQGNESCPVETLDIYLILNKGENHPMISPVLGEARGAAQLQAGAPVNPLERMMGFFVPRLSREDKVGNELMMQAISAAREKLRSYNNPKESTTDK